MENKNIKFITVEQTFHIGGSSTDEILERFKRLIDSGIIDINKAMFCRIKYVTNKNNVEDGPINIYFLDGTHIKLNLTVGYRGTGPHGTCKILKICKFDFDENDILLHQDIVDIRYYKDIDKETIYQFKNMDGSYEYSTL